MSDFDDFPVQPETLVTTTQLLLDAYNFAANAGRPPEHYAVEIVSLHKAGASREFLRWIWDSGYARHLIEKTQIGDPERSFDDAPPASLDDASCFVLTQSGIEFAGNFLQRFSVETTSSDSRDNGWPKPDKPNNGHSPNWDDLRGELSVNGNLVKRLLSNAKNQRLILQALQEEGWPSSIDDPLPPGPNGDPTMRLRSAIRRLDADHLVETIRFEISGSKILWRIVPRTPQWTPGVKTTDERV